MTRKKNASILNMINRTNVMLDADMGHHMALWEEIGYRQGLCAALEAVLHENGVYNGFSYTDKAGMTVHPEGHPHAGYCATLEDETRRKYNPHPFLLKGR